MTYTLGVDLGTATSAAAVVRDRQLEPCPLGESSLTVPSIVLPRDDGRTLIGEAAALHGGIAPVRLARAGAGGAGPLDALEAFDAHEAMCMLLDAVIDQVATDRGGRPARLALVQPATHATTHAAPDGPGGGPYGWVAAEAPGDPMLVAAPVASATLVNHERGLTAGSTVGVLDLGGDVSEAALVRRTGTGFDVVGRPCRAPGIGGSEIDTILLRHIDAALDNAVSALGPSPDTDPAAFDRLLAGCRRAKEQLLHSDDAVVEVGLPRMTARVRLTRAELQRLVHPHLARAVAALERTIAETGLSGDDLEAVVLVGGSARLPAAAELVAERIGRPVVVGAAPELTAALGAALVGTPAAERPDPAPAPTVPLATLAATTATPAGGTVTFPPTLTDPQAGLGVGWRGHVSGRPEAELGGEESDGSVGGEAAGGGGRRRRLVERSVARWRHGDGRPAHRSPAPRHRARWAALRRTADASSSGEDPDTTDTDAATTGTDPDTGDQSAHTSPADVTDSGSPGAHDGRWGRIRRGEWVSGVGGDRRRGRIERRGRRGGGPAVRSGGGLGGHGGGEALASDLAGGRDGAGERDRSGRRVLVASATLLVLMAVGGTLLATGAGNRDGDQRPADSIQTSEHPASGGVPGLSDPARPTSIGSTSSLDSRTGETTTSSSTATDGDRTSSDGSATASDSATDGAGAGEHEGDGGTADDRESRGDGSRPGDGRYASDPSDTTDPPTTGGPPVTAPERPDSPPTTTAPPAPAPQPQPEPNLIENLFEILLGDN